ncbi:MAG TPA: hypothetical protein VN581_10635 [Patescibacteria group bacterium]|nr:hypothetical protein [Patescibacteria group bacterium]
MNERQRDMFLWQWSRRRVVGPLAVALGGALVGAAGGVVFALILFGDFGTDNGSVAAFLALLEQGAAALVLAVPAFAGIGCLGASRVFAANEAMYQSMIKSGARVPEHPPQLRAGDRGPAIAVAVAMAMIVAFIGFVWIRFG